MNLFLWISQCSGPGQARPLMPRPTPAPAPRPPLSISQSARQNPLQCKPLLNTGGSLLFSPPYLFMLALPLPSSHSPNKKRLNSRGGQKKDEQRQAFRAERGIFRWRMWLAKVECGIEWVERRPVPSRGFYQLRAQRQRLGPPRRAANTCSLFRGHNREVKLQPPPPGGLSCPGLTGTQGDS